MINIKETKNNQVRIEYNTKNGVKVEFGEFKELVHEKGDSIVPDYACLYEKWGNRKKRFNYFLNTVLQLQEKFINNLEFPKLVFYDIETDRGANDLNNSEVNSIAWIDDDNEEYCLIKGVDGSEKEIIEQFTDYCKKNNIMGLVGHNSKDFDNIIMIKRCKHHKINYNLFYNDCNLDTMILASFLQFTNNKYTGLNDLADLLSVEENKTDTGIYNPVTLYNEDIKEYENGNEEKIKLFREYNMQDVRLCKSCFEEMNVKPQLTELFKQSRCPFNKIQYNTVLLNHYTCKYLHSRNIKVSESVNTEIKFKNAGGLNYCSESDELQVYNNVLVADIVSYYPHLLMLINADPYNQYDNINRETGEIKPFRKSDKVGLICELSKGLYESRAETKKEMEQTEDKELKQQLNYEQLTKKIIVNSLYGLLNQKNGNYILKNDLIAATITEIGRDILQHIVKEFGAVYAKTDSVFIPLEKDDKPEFILNAVNIEVSKFVKDKYNLNNVTSNGQLIRFEEDSITDKLVLKDKNNYVKIDGDEYKFKGGDFNSSTLSDFEKDNIKTILKHIDLLEAGKSLKLKDILIENSETILKSVSNVKYFSKSKKLSEDQKDQRIIKDGIKYMENEDLPYSYGFSYLYCSVEDDRYNYIMFPKGYNPDLKINPVFVYDLLIKQMKKLKIINNRTKKELDKKYNIKSLNNKNKQIKDKYITNKDIVDLNNYNESDIINKRTFKSISNNNIKELNNIIPDTSLYYEKGLLTFIPVKAGTKSAYNIKGIQYNEEYLSKLNINDLIEEKDNFGVAVRYKNLQVFDIDGNKTLWKRLYHQEEWDNPKIKNKDIKLTEEEQEELQLLKDYIFNTFIKIDYPFIVQCSQSGGYHLLYTAPEPCNLNNIYYPEDLEITGIREETLEEIRGSAFKHSIDINVNYIVFAPSAIDDKHQYKLFKNNYKWSNIFNNEITDIEERIDDTFKKAGFIVKERKYVNTTKKNKSENKFKKENNISTNSELKKEFLEDRELFKLLVEEHKNQTGNHNQSIAVFTSILKFIGLEDDEAVNYMDKVLTAADDNTTEHTNQVTSYINSNDGTKPNFKEYLNSKELNNKLDTYLNTIIYPTKKKLKNKANRNNKKSKKNKTKNKHNRDDTNLYEELKGSFANYVGEIPYILNEEFISRLNSQIDILKEKIQNKPIIILANDKKVYDICDLVQGSLYHYGFTEEDRYKIIKDGELPIQVIDGKELIYGFPYLKEWIKTNINNDGVDKLIIAINKMIGYIKLNPLMNPIFYDDGEDTGYIQMKKQLIKKNKNGGNKKILNCTFKKIIKQVQLGNKTGVEKETKYTFVLALYKNNRNVTLENKTIEDLYDYINKKNLFLENLNTLKTDLIRFINFADNKGDIEEKETAYIEGFVIEGDDENYKIIPYFPSLKKSKYTIEEAITELNSIYYDVYECNTNFIKVINWFLIHVLREVWFHYGIEDSILTNLLQYGKEGTGKTNSIATAFAFFISDKNKFKQIGQDADTKASINRAYGNSTLPLVVDEPDFPITEIYPLAKKSTFTRIGSTKAKDQFGSDNREFPVTRQIVINQNPIPEAKEGANRRFSIIEHTDDDILSDKQKEELSEHWIGAGNKTPILKLNKIGEEIIKFVTRNTEWMNKNINEIANTKGFLFLEVFYKYLNDNSTVKLNEDFYNQKLYTFDKLEINYKIKFQERFTYNFTKGVNNVDLTQYQPYKIKEMLKNTTYINIREKDGQEYIFIEWEGLDKFIRSNGGLEKSYTKRGFLKMLGIENKEFKQHRLDGTNLDDSKNDKKDNRERGLLLSITEFYKYFFNKEID